MFEGIVVGEFEGIVVGKFEGIVVGKFSVILDCGMFMPNCSRHIETKIFVIYRNK
jgi:hypothetical protein